MSGSDASGDDDQPWRAAPRATFHARVASVGLITTVVVLIAACLTFMLQQWAVARTQSHRFHESLTEMVATASAPAMTPLEQIGRAHV